MTAQTFYAGVLVGIVCAPGFYTFVFWMFDRADALWGRKN